ncbi:MAG: metallophosphoesterase [Bacillota bacterium]
MRIFALGDPHLSFDGDGNIYKPMDIFGSNWEQHHLKIAQNWREKVSQEDVVLVPGDISWALKLEEAVDDINFIGSLPGIKILVKGNHDLWWQSVTKVKKVLPQGMHVIQNDNFLVSNDYVICGTRGWNCPGDKGFDEIEDRKVYERELIRLRMSLNSIKQKNREIIVMLHYPPTNGKHEISGFIEILQEYKVNKCIYAHLHSDAVKSRLPETKWGIEFHLVSADAINFSPKLICTIE